MLHEHKKYALTRSDKLEIVEALMKYGIRYMEVFSPIVNGNEGKDLPFIIAKRDKIQKKLNQPMYILAHCRCDPKDVETAIKAGVDGLNLYFRTSDLSHATSSNITLNKIIKKVRPLIKDIRKNHPSFFIRFSAEDAFRTNLENLFAVYDSVVELVDRLGLPDTVGTAMPSDVQEKINKLQNHYPNMEFEGHFHNDRGLSLINSITAIKTGLKYINASVLGLGERSGITSTTALFFNLYLKDPTMLDEYSISASYPLNVLVADIFKMIVPSTEPISLTNRIHNAGVHTGAVLKDPRKYEAHCLDKFGLTKSKLLLGPLSGWHVVNYYLNEILRFTGVSEKQVKEITNEFKARCSELNCKKTSADLLLEIACQRGLVQITPPKKPLINLR